MRTGRPKAELLVTSEEREALERRVRRRGPRRRGPRGARIVLGCATGGDESVRRRARRGMVGNWRARFVSRRRGMRTWNASCPARWKPCHGTPREAALIACGTNLNLEVEDANGEIIRARVDSQRSVQLGANEEGTCGDSIDAAVQRSSARHPRSIVTRQRPVRATAGRIVSWLRAPPRKVHERLLLSEAELGA